MKLKITAGLLAVSWFAAYAQQTLHAKKGTIWVSFEEDGHQFMVGALKEFASAQDDPGFAQTDFGKGYSVKIESGDDTILYHNCCTKNIVIGDNYTGTIEIGGKKFTISDLRNRE